MPPVIDLTEIEDNKYAATTNEEHPSFRVYFHNFIYIILCKVFFNEYNVKKQNASVRWASADPDGWWLKN
jgi:hypothetical protein